MDTSTMPAAFKPLAKNRLVPLMCVELYIDTDAVCFLFILLSPNLNDIPSIIDVLILKEVTPSKTMPLSLVFLPA